MNWTFLTGLGVWAVCAAARAATPVSHLQAAARDGQVFLTWQEAETPAGTTFNVYRADGLIADESEHYAITILAEYPGLEYPVRTDVTLRRVRKFKTAPGEGLNVRIGDAPPVSITADGRGRITIPQIAIPSQAGVRMTIRRADRDTRAAS